MTRRGATVAGWAVALLAGLAGAEARAHGFVDGVAPAGAVVCTLTGTFRGWSPVAQAGGAAAFLRLELDAAEVEGTCPALPIVWPRALTGAPFREELWEVGGRYTLPLTSDGASLGVYGLAPRRIGGAGGDRVEPARRGSGRDSASDGGDGSDRGDGSDGGDASGRDSGSDGGDASDRGDASGRGDASDRGGTRERRSAAARELAVVRSEAGAPVDTIPSWACPSGGRYRRPDADRIRMRMDGDPPPGWDRARVLAAIGDAMAYWNATPCAGVRFELTDDPAVRDSIAFVTTGFSAGFGGAGTLAFTAPTLDADRCAIPAASIVVNAEAHTWSDRCDGLGWDAVGVLVHELGHVLGYTDLYEDGGWDLAASVMYGRASTWAQSASRRSLREIDERTTCAVYPCAGGDCASPPPTACGAPRPLGDGCADDAACGGSVVCCGGDGSCVTGDGAGVCSRACASDWPCPDGWRCAEAGAEGRCEPTEGLLEARRGVCLSCAEDAACGVDARCVSVDGEPVCVPRCGRDGGCPEGWICEAARDAHGIVIDGLCRPSASGSCGTPLRTGGCAVASGPFPPALPWAALLWTLLLVRKACPRRGGRGDLRRPRGAVDAAGGNG